MCLDRIRSYGLHLMVPTLWAITGAAAWAQAPTPASEVPAPTLRVTTHLVLVDVVVTDKQGKPVNTLRPEDFVLEENGKAQKISMFAKPTEKAAAQPLPPGIYSNRPQYRSPGAAITVMLLDALNTEFKDQAYARRQMLRFVQEQYKPGARMAVFTLTGGLGVLQDFTSDPQILYAALQRFNPQPQEFASAARPGTTMAQGTPNAGSVVTAMDASTAPVTTANSGSAGLHGAGADAQLAATQAAVAAFAGIQVAYAEDQRAVITLNALNSLSRILGGLPGRKSVIWVTGHLPFSLIPENSDVSKAELEEDLPSFDTRRAEEHGAGSNAAFLRQSHAGEVRETAARLASAQVAIYPVDARGLSISTDVDSQETMREMARETGGRAYVNQNEIKDGVERAFDDASATYTLGYYPENKKYDGKYRSIKVKVNQGGIESFHRRGYYAIDPSQIKGYNPSQEVASALNNPVAASQVSFSARVVAADANSAKGKLGVDFLVDASTLSAEDSSGAKKMTVLFYSTMYSADGKLISNESNKVDQAFDNDTYQKILQHGMLLHMDVDPKIGANQVRLAVQDGRTGLVGTIHVPLN